MCVTSHFCQYSVGFSLFVTPDRWDSASKMTILPSLSFFHPDPTRSYSPEPRRPKTHHPTLAGAAPHEPTTGEAGTGARRGKEDTGG